MIHRGENSRSQSLSKRMSCLDGQVGSHSMSRDGEVCVFGSGIKSFIVVEDKSIGSVFGSLLLKERKL